VWKVEPKKNNLRKNWFPLFAEGRDRMKKTNRGNHAIFEKGIECKQ